MRFGAAAAAVFAFVLVGSPPLIRHQGRGGGGVRSGLVRFGAAAASFEAVASWFGALCAAAPAEFL